MIEKIKRVMELAYIISTNEDNLTVVFLEYSAHINLLSIRIYYQGWASEDELVDEFKNADTTLKYVDWLAHRTNTKNMNCRLDDNANFLNYYTINELIEELEGLL